MQGLLLVNKPVGISSFDCIRKLQRILRSANPELRPPKIGHAGTLDPAASGLMLLLVGAATKRAGSFSKLDKVYTAQITLGQESSTGDREGQMNKISGKVPTAPEIEKALHKFVGTITQTPPVYSAIKIDGKRAYKLAREGKAVEMPSRQVTIYELRTTSYDYPKLSFTVKVSSGTYIRSLAEDIGRELGTGAYLSSLVRVEVGEYSLNSAINIDELTSESVSAKLLPLES